MKIRSGHPFPLLKNGIRAVYPPHTRDERCDVLVIGAGVSGALAAERLSREGHDVVVLDKRDAASGSSAATTALLQYEIDTPMRILSRKVGAAHAERAYLLGVDAIDALEHLASKIPQCGFRRRHSLYLAKTMGDVAGLETEFQLRKKLGIRNKYLGAGEVSDLFSFSAPAALYSDAAAEMDCTAFTHGVLAMALRNGARVYDRSEAVKIKREKNGFIVTTERNFYVTARRIVFATGYESARFIPKENTGKLISTYAIASEPMNSFKGWHERCLIWETGTPYYYLRTTDDNRVFIGGLDEDFQSPEKRDALIPRKATILHNRFVKFFPSLPFETYCAWAGTFGSTKDGLGFLGEAPSFPGAFFVLGYGGNGITFSMIATDLIADWVVGKKNTDADIFRFRR